MDLLAWLNGAEVLDEATSSSGMLHFRLSSLFVTAASGECRFHTFIDL